MKKPLYLLFISIALILFTSCTDTTKSDEEAEDNGITPSIGAPLEEEEVVSKDSSFQSENDTLSYTFTATAGGIYTVDIDEENYDFYVEVEGVYLPSGERLDVELYDYDAVQATVAGEYTVKLTIRIYDESLTAPYNFSIEINEVASLEGSLDGMWILVKEEYQAFDQTSTVNYSVTNADEVLVFDGDNMTKYYYDSYYEEEGDSPVYEDIYLFADHWLSELNYNVSGNTLTFSASASFGSQFYTYEKYDGAISSLTWARENVTVPSELIGTWYLAAAEWTEEWVEDGEENSESEDTTYGSGVDSRRIFVITTDSITSYYKDGLGEVDVYTESASNNYWMLNSLKKDGSNLVESEVYFEYDGEGDYYAGSEMVIYKPYSGELPPAEWLEFTVPQTTNLPLGESVTGAIVSNDTAWFNISVNEGDSYEITATTDFYSLLALLNNTPEKLDDSWGGSSSPTTISFTADYTGEYVFCIAGDWYEEYGSFEVNFNTYSEDENIYYSNARSSTAKKPSKSNRKSVLRNKRR
jgi:hypothetical protein